MRKNNCEKFVIFVFGNSVPKPMIGMVAWIKLQGGFFRNGNFIKYIVRMLLPKFFPSAKPSRVLVAALKSTNHTVIDFSRLKVGPKDFSPDNFDHDEDSRMWEKIATGILSEHTSTDYLNSKRQKQMIKRSKKSVETIHEIVRRIALEMQPSSMHYFNGRSLHERACVEVAKKLRIQSNAYESNVYGDRMQSYDNSIANLKFVGEAEESFWLEYVQFHGEKKAEAKASEYFEKRKESSSLNPFLSYMTSEFEDKGLDDKQIYTFFTSSSEEMYSIYSYYHEEKFNQEILLRELFFEFSKVENQDKMLIIRVHPNIRFKKRRDRFFYKSLISAKNILVINYDSKVSSYDLLSKSDFVLTTSSTIGLEAAFFRKPTFNFARTYWQGLNLSTQAKSTSDLFFLSPVDIGVAQKQAMKAGLFFSEYGLPYKHIDINRLRILDSRHTFDALHRLNMKF